MTASAVRGRRSESEGREERDENYSKVVTPEVLIGGPVPVSPGFHFDKLSVASPVEPPLKACGNDGLRKGSRSDCKKWRSPYTGETS
jgi:hypothetical protein